MFNSIANLVSQKSKKTFGFSVLLIIVFGIFGSQAIPKLQNGGYTAASSDSSKATTYLENTFKARDPIAILQISSSDPLVSSNTMSEESNLENTLLKIPNVTKVLSYWNTGNSPQLLSADGKTGLLYLYSNSDDFGVNTKIGKTLSAMNSKIGSLQISYDGIAPLSSQLSDRITKDLAKAESISVPLTFILLLFIFGGLVSSAMPLVVGAASIFGALFIIWLITLITPVSIFALNLTTGLGLGLGIDYSLLIVNRFREELHNGASTQDAVVTTVKTAGKTVFFSGLTVLLTLASLLFFPLMFLRSFGYAGVAVVFTAVLGALIPLPALLAILGPRIDKFLIRKSVKTPKAHGNWSKIATFVMKRPIPVVLLAAIIITTVSLPIKDIVFSQEDARTMPATSSVAMADSQLQKNFPNLAGGPIEIIIPNGVKENSSALQSYLTGISKVPGVSQVGRPEAQGNAIRIQAYESIPARSAAAQKLIDTLRKLSAPAGTVIGGQAAIYTDTQETIAKTLPLVGIWIAVAVLILLFLFTGSVLLPIKAVILNGFSLMAMLGALTYIFVLGHLKWLVGSFTNTGAVSTSMVILIAITTFGLSMDYEVFLLSRIREEHDRGSSTVNSVANGLQKSGRIITAAAILLAVVFSAFVTSGVTSIKSLGFGVAFAILLDATIIRALLVPALMALFGKLNWWAPKSLQRFSVKH